MNSYQLVNYFSSSLATKPYFWGVFSSNNVKLPEYNKETQYFIVINTSPSFHKGIHWISIFKPYNGRCIFIDSLGASPCNYGSTIVQTLNHMTMNTEFNEEYECVAFGLQSVTSNLCGLYCIFYYVTL